MKQSEEHGVGIGNASILLIFIVLTLSIFSVLTLISAEAERFNSERSAEAVSAYYLADREACIKYNTICETVENAFSVDDVCGELRAMDCNVSEDEIGLTISYYTDIDENRRLFSKLRYENGSIFKVSWRTEGKSELEINDDINVWDGSELPIG